MVFHGSIARMRDEHGRPFWDRLDIRAVMDLGVLNAIRENYMPWTPWRQLAMEAAAKARRRRAIAELNPVIVEGGITRIITGLM